MVSTTASDLQWGEAAGQLRYLSVRLLDYAAALPDRSLPPRGRVPWSPDEVAELGHWTRVLERGEPDAARVAAALGAIDGVFRRETGDQAAADRAPTAEPPGVRGQRSAEAALLDLYLAQRAIAMDTLPRLQRLGDVRPAPVSAPRPSWWLRLRERALGRFREKRSP